MSRTVDSEEWASRKQRYYALFFLGAFMCTAAVMLTLPALQYEFQQGTTGAPTGGDGVPYDVLTAEEQRVVDGAIDGEQYVFETSQPLPGTPGLTLEPAQIEVDKGGTIHTFTYRAVFPATEPMGMAVVGLAVGGVLAMVEAIRRRHFAN